MRKVALVTGSTRGIGLNIVQKLAENNYNVIITGKSTNDPVRGDIYKAEELIKKIQCRYISNTIRYKKFIFN